ncbi:hypothetical protein [Flaviaesturariibacter amylovorans]|uniref:SO2946-like C-terminal domain-containing protein n=1 Tax=Flaviaesturariibacter amylovorans TaxID=1084520 RepID=A0ABP8GQX6_9BACT
MKRLLTLLFCFVSLTAAAQVPQKNGTWYEFRLAIIDSLGIPKDTFMVPATLRHLPWLSSKGDTLYVWSTDGQKWRRPPAGASNLQETTDGGNGTTNDINIRVGADDVLGLYPEDNHGTVGFRSDAGHWTYVTGNLATGTRQILWPNGSGRVALTDSVIQNQYTTKQPANAYLDSLKALRLNVLGGLNGQLTDTINHIYLPVKASTGQTTTRWANSFVISNRTREQDMAKNGWYYWTSRGNSTLLSLNREFYFSEGDSASVQYNASLSSFTALYMDHANPRYNTGSGVMKMPTLQSGGFNSVYRFGPTTDVQVWLGIQGRNAGNYHSTFDFATDSNYIVRTYQGSATRPTPLAAGFVSDIDFDRNLDGKQRIFTGEQGIANFIGMYKSAQSGSPAARGSSVGQVTDFYSLGVSYKRPYGTSHSKATILADSKIDTAVGFYSYPKWEQYNEVGNWPVGFWQAGASDVNTFEGQTFFGFPYLPGKATADSNTNRSATFFKPAEYYSNQGSGFTARSLVDKGYVDSVAAGVSSGVTVDTAAMATRLRVMQVADSLSALIPALNRSRRYDYFTDFNATAGEWTVTSSGGSVTAVNSPVNRPGVIRLSTGSTATGRYAVHGGLSNTSTFGGGTWSLETAVRITTASDATDRYQLLVGFLGAVNTVNQTDGAYFLYDEGGVSTGSTAAGYWQTVTAASSSRTFNQSHTPVTASTATWYKLRIEVNAAASQVLFYVNGTLAGTHTGTIPTSATGFAIYVQKSLGTTSRTIDADYMQVQSVFTTPR